MGFALYCVHRETCVSGDARANQSIASETSEGTLLYLKSFCKVVRYPNCECSDIEKHALEYLVMQTFSVGDCTLAAGIARVLRGACHRSLLCGWSFWCQRPCSFLDREEDVITTRSNWSDYGYRIQTRTEGRPQNKLLGSRWCCPGTVNCADCAVAAERGRGGAVLPELR